MVISSFLTSSIKILMRNSHVIIVVFVVFVVRIILVIMLSLQHDTSIEKFSR